MDQPKKISNPAALEAILQGFIADYENMESHVTKQELHLQHLTNRVVHLKELLGIILNSHGAKESTLAPRIIKKITAELEKQL